MADMCRLVLRSFRHGDRTSPIPRQPFLLNDSSRGEASEYHVDLVLDSVHWQYRFKVDDQRVLGEYAYFYPHGRRSLLFEATG